MSAPRRSGGPDTAHQLINTGEKPLLKYIGVSTTQ
jgi:uncharacterized cupin superfamily protein